MTDLKQLALEAATTAIGYSPGVTYDVLDPDQQTDVKELAVAMLRFAAKVKGEACIHQAADELEGKP